jgi:hypothetical protein
MCSTEMVVGQQYWILDSCYSETKNLQCTSCRFCIMLGYLLILERFSVGYGASAILTEVRCVSRASMILGRVITQRGPFCIRSAQLPSPSPSPFLQPLHHNLRVWTNGRALSITWHISSANPCSSVSSRNRVDLHRNKTETVWRDIGTNMLIRTQLATRSTCISHSSRPARPGLIHHQQARKNRSLPSSNLHSILSWIEVLLFP